MLCSDGVFDNLFIDEEFKKCITNYLDKNGVFLSMSSAADCIALKANALSYVKDYMSPFT